MVYYRLYQWCMCMSLGGLKVYKWIKDVWFEGSNMQHVEGERKWKKKQRQLKEWNKKRQKRMIRSQLWQQSYSLLSNDYDCANKMFKFIQNDSGSNENVPPDYKIET